jgi:hypothetical protein
MSMWLESLSYCLYDAGDDLESRAKCILSYLSMDVPRSWWKQALKTNSIPSSYASILRDLRKKLLRVPSLPEKIDFGLFVALAFTDDDNDKRESKFGYDDSPYSLEEYLDKAREILIARPELGGLGRLIDSEEINSA